MKQFGPSLKPLDEFRRVNLELNKILKLLKEHAEKIDSFNKKLENVEDSVFCISQNIQRIRFLSEEKQND
jgi:hypothetical protein